VRPLQIALKDFKVVSRDLKALAVIIGMPLILVMILGAALGPMFRSSDRISPFKVAVVDLDQGQMAHLFLDALSSEQLRSLITMENAESLEAARALIADKKVTAAVIIPKSPSDPDDRSPRAFKVLGDPGNAVKSDVLKGIVDSFAEQYSVISAGTTGVIETLLQAAGPSSPARLDQYPGGVEALEGSIIDSLSRETAEAAGIFSKSTESSGRITSVQYYTASMTVMFVMFGAMLGAKSIIEERGNRTLARLFSTGVTAADLLVGKTLATFAISYAQILILVLFTRFVYRVKWGPSMANVFVVSAAIALAATGFAMLIAAIAGTEKRVDAFENIGIQVMAFLGGCQYPIYGFPKAVQSVSKLTLTRWGLDAYLTLMDGQGLAGVVTPLLVLAAMGTAFLALGIRRLRLD
jgi:ABC-2 type transport system permease protein